MIYLIGGVSKSGKTTLMQRITKKHDDILTLNFDVITVLFQKFAPNMDLKLSDNYTKRSSNSLPINKFLLELSKSYKQDCCLEGDHLNPEDFKEYEKIMDGDIKMVFLGYDDADIETKVQHIDKDKRLSWFKNMDHKTKVQQVTVLKERSSKFKKLIENINSPKLKYFSTYSDFNHNLDMSLRFLLDK